MRVWHGPLAIALVFATTFSTSAVGHHSRAYFGDELVEITGELVSVDWRNPHIGLTVRAPASDGSTQSWLIEGNSIYNLQRRGVSRDVFEPGRRVTVTGRASTRNDHTLLMRSISFGEGSTLAFTGREAPPGHVDNVVDAAAENRGIFRVWSMPAADRAAIQAQTDDQPFTESALAARAAFNPLEDLAFDCEPEGMPRIMVNPHPFEFIDRGDELILRTGLYDIERVIHMNRDAPPADTVPSRLGYSVGAWENGTLVVRTNHVNWPYFDRAGTPQSEDVEILERFTLSDDQARLDFDITITDPATFTQPARLRGYWLALGESILRYDCVPLGE